MNQNGYRIERYEQAKPEGAVFDEVRYKAKGGLRVNYVIGTVLIDGFPDGKATGDLPAMAGMRTVMVTWDSEGLCRRRSNNERMPEFDIKLDETWT